MPLPQINPSEQETDYIGRCMAVTTKEYETESQAYAVCKSTWDKETMFKSEFKRKRLLYPPMKKETMIEFISRCRVDDMVKLKFPNKNERSLFCFREFK
jgi:hypothetical protein